MEREEPFGNYENLDLDQLIDLVAERGLVFDDRPMEEEEIRENAIGLLEIFDFNIDQLKTDLEKLSDENLYHLGQELGFSMAFLDRTVRDQLIRELKKYKYGIVDNIKILEQKDDEGKLKYRYAQEKLLPLWHKKYEDYSKLPIDQLKALAERWGINPNRNREDIERDLYRLDDTIKATDYQDRFSTNLVLVAEIRGIKPELIPDYEYDPDVDEPLTPEQRANLIDLLHTYDLALYLDDPAPTEILTPAGVKIFQDFQHKLLDLIEKKENIITPKVEQGAKYDDLTLQQLRQLAETRGIQATKGLNEEEEREDLTGDLEWLDQLLAMSMDEISNFEMFELIDNAQFLGFTQDFLDPYIKRNDDGALMDLIYNFGLYNLTLDEKNALTVEGNKKYRYAGQKTGKIYGRDKKEVKTKAPLVEPTVPQDNIPVRRVTPLVTPRRPPGTTTPPKVIPTTPPKTTRKIPPPPAPRKKTQIRRGKEEEEIKVPTITPRRRALPTEITTKVVATPPGRVDLLSEAQVRKMTIPQLKDWLDQHGIPRVGYKLKEDFVQAVLRAQGGVKTELTKTTLKETKKEGITATRKLIQDSLKRDPISKSYKNLDVNPNFTPNSLANGIITSVYYQTDNRFGNGSNPVDAIMIRGNDELATDVLVKLHYPLPLIRDLSFPDKINLLWWIYATQPYYIKNNLGKELTKPIATLKREYPELKDLSAVEIIYVLRHGTKVPKLNINTKAAALLDQYTSADIFKVVKYLYGKQTPFMYETIQPYSVYQLFLEKEPSPMIPFILEWDGSDPTSIAEQVGMIFPPQIDPDNIDAKITYFLSNLEKYAPVYTRPDPIDPPPILEDVPEADVMRILSQYTDVELLDAYEITFDDWSSRRDFLEKIALEAIGGAKWSFRNRRCANIPGENLILGEERTTTDPDDPIISYGTLNNYRCYQISELEGSFTYTEEEGFTFRVPDWIKESFRQPGQTYPEIREFPTASIRQLKRLLETANQPIYKELLTKITNGLADKGNVKRMITKLKDEYQRFAPEDQSTAQDYIFWMFLLGMYMRFWKGPGFPYPMEWIEGGGGPERCELGIRDENTSIAMADRDLLLEGIPDQLREWILNLPRIRYDFTTGSVAAGKETINFVINEARKGNFCIADASDHLLRTSYYLALSLLGLSNEDFNNNLSDIFGLDQPPFEPNKVTGTGHRDPFHDLQDEDDEDKPQPRLILPGLPLDPRMVEQMRQMFQPR